MIGSVGSRAQPQIPVQRLGHLGRVLGTLDALGPVEGRLAAVRRPIRPGMHLPHRPDRVVPDPLIDQPIALEGHALVAHLGGDLGLAGRLPEGPCLEHGPRQRLLAVDVLAQLDRHHAHDRVNVVGCAHDDRVDALFLLEHDAKVLVLPGLGVSPERVPGVVPVDVAQSDDVLAADVVQVAGPLPPDADAGNVELVARRRIAHPAQDVPGHDRERRRSSAGAKQGPPSQRCRSKLRAFLGCLHMAAFLKSQSSEFNRIVRGYRNPCGSSTTFGRDRGAGPRCTEVSGSSLGGSGRLGRRGRRGS